MTEFYGRKIVHKLLKAMRTLSEEGPSAVFSKIKDNIAYMRYSSYYEELLKKGLKPSRNPDNRTGYAAFDSEYQENTDFSEYKTDVKALAFYLPQYHSFPENDAWWGRGFTEWTNVKKGSPAFEGHYQPRIPHKDIGYYSLENIETLKKQATLAKQHGIYGFCFYYYWFSGKRLMEKPVDMLLEHPEIDLPFCLCWANENWTRAWDGKTRDILIAQEYSEKDDGIFIPDMKRYLDDRRYIRIDGKPVILVYNPSQIRDCRRSFSKWRESARRLGIGEILIWTVQTSNSDAKKLKITDIIDAEVEFPPHNFGINGLLVHGLETERKSAAIFNYQLLSEYVCKCFSYEEDPVPLHRGIMLSWDNSARKKEGWVCYYAYSLRSLYRWTLEAAKKTREDFAPEERFMFINAWNEWGEGTYLEPDEKYGYSNINTVSKALFGLPFKKDLEFIDGNTPECRNVPKAAVQVHMFYTDTAADMAEQLNNIPFPFDLYISTDNDEKKAFLEKCFGNNCRCSSLTVSVFENRGRDVFPFLKQMAPVIGNYEYIGHFHSKKTSTNVHGNEWREYIFRHLLSGSDYLKKIFGLLENDCSLGIIMPEVYPVLEKQAEWGGNEEGVKAILQKCGCGQDLPDIPDFPVGDMFWARTKAVAPVFESVFSPSDFPAEAGQENGTLAHCIERSWVYIAKSQGFRYIKVFNNMPYTEKAPEARRLGVFAHYDRSDTVSDEDLETLKRMRQVMSDIVFVSNNDLPEEELLKIRPLVVSALIRENKGMDFGAWKAALSDIGKKDLGNYDELVLFNNSCLPPVFDMRRIFEEMEQRGPDFWGMTLFPYSPDGSYIGRDHIPEHLQSYFTVFSKKVFESDAFWSFWESIGDSGSYKEVVANCETRLTGVLANAGFKYEPYIKETYYLRDFLKSDSIPYEKPCSLLLLGSPLVKKKCYEYMDEAQRIELETLMADLRSGNEKCSGKAAEV